MMNERNQTIPVEVLHLIPELDAMLIDLLSSLSDDEWQLPTVARLWSVKDVAAHLLDGNLRGLSTSRDRYFGGQPFSGNSNSELVSYLTQLNLEWTNAAKRLSPGLLIYLLRHTNDMYASHLKSLPPFEKAIFPVAWAGEVASLNWFHIAREYTEKFLHQQQIRSAIGNSELLNSKYFHPFLQISMYALPFTYKDVAAPNGTVVTLVVSSDTGGSWSIIKTDKGWQTSGVKDLPAAATVTIDPESAWKLFSGSLKPYNVMEHIKIEGRADLAAISLKMLCVMA